MFIAPVGLSRNPPTAYLNRVPRILRSLGLAVSPGYPFTRRSIPFRAAVFFVLTVALSPRLSYKSEPEKTLH